MRVGDTPVKERNNGSRVVLARVFCRNQSCVLSGIPNVTLIVVDHSLVRAMVLMECVDLLFIRALYFERYHSIALLPSL